MPGRQILIAKYLSRGLTSPEKEELERWLLEDPKHLADFSETLLVDYELRRLSKSARDFLACAEPSSAAETGTEKGDSARNSIPSAQPESGSRRVSSLGRRSLLPAWVVAASLAIVASAALLGYFEGTDRVAENADRSAERPAPAVKERSVAYLGRTSDCVWQSPVLNEGAHLSAGSRIALAKGLAEVIFENGARVTVQGPCDLFVDDSQACSLRLGDASVYVPESAFGFKLVTPSGIVVDLGTAFGVTVDQQGSSEVHVFEGEILFQGLNANGSHQAKAVRLPAARAFQYSIGGTTLREFAANEARFKWRIREPLQPEEVPPLPVRDSLALWLAADRYVEVDEQNRVSCWRDLLVAGNTSAEDALQLEKAHRPTLIEKGINGKPSIHFGDGDTFLLTPPLNTGNEQTAIVVLSLWESTPTFQTVINYNGPPQRIVGPLGGLVEPGVFEICLRDRDADQRFAVCGEVFSGYENGRRKVIKSIVQGFDVMPTGRPMVVAFRYSLSDERMTLFLNGRERQSDHADTPIAIASRKIIGRHPILSSDLGVFHGDIGEVLIYNRALSDAEVREVSQQLMKSFEIEK